MARLVMGIQPVREVVRVHGKNVERLLVQRAGGPKLEALARWAEQQGIPVELSGIGDLDRKAAGGRHQGVIALAPELRVVPGVDRLVLEPANVIIALDGIMDPQNFGAVIRSAVALGASAVLWPEHSSAPLSPAMFRASAGAVEHAVLCRVSALPEALEELASRGATTIGLDAQGPTELSAIDLKGPSVIVIGAEDKGLRRPVRRACRFTARLPMAGPIASLNASVAGALALYEVFRQRIVPGPSSA